MSAGSGNRPKWTEVISVFIALAALVLSIYSINKSDKIEKDVKKASVRYGIYIAKNPGLTDQLDKDWYTSQQLAPHVIHTDYQVSALANYEVNSQKGFLFLLLINDGPSDVKSMKISSINWKPSLQTTTIPYGIDVKNTLSTLRKDHFYAILIDILEPINMSKEWSISNFDLNHPNYETVDVNLVYEDGLSSSNPMEVHMESSIEPLPIEIPPN